MHPSHLLRHLQLISKRFYPEKNFLWNEIGIPDAATECQLSRNEFMLCYDSNPTKTSEVSWDGFSRLPDDVLIHVFNFLETSALKICSSVCKRWHVIHCKMITKLRVTHQKRLNEQFNSLMSAIDSFPNLSSVAIENFPKALLPPLMHKLSSSSKLSLHDLHFQYSFPLKSEEIDILFQFLFTNINLSKLTLNFSEPVPCIDLSNFKRLKSLSFFVNWKGEGFRLSSSQTKRMEEMKLYVSEKGDFSLLERLFGSENAKNWTNLKRFYLKMDTFVKLDSIVLQNWLISFPKLQCLELLGGFGLEERLDLVCTLPNLNRLVIDNTNLPSVPPWLLQLQNLTFLEMNTVKDVRSILSLARLSKLKHLRMTVRNFEEGMEARSEESIPWIQEMAGLESLHLTCFGFDVLLPSIHKLASMEELKLHVQCAQSLTVIGLSRLRRLRSLSLVAIHVRFLLTDFAWETFSKLDKVKVHFTKIPGLGCRKVTNVSVDFSKLTSLTLTFNKEQDKDMHCIGHFTALKHLSLSFSTVTELPPSFSNLKSLQSFQLASFYNLRSITFLQNCPLLQFLRIHWARKLTFVSESFFKLKHLHKVVLVQCPKLTKYESRFRDMALCFENE